MPPRIAFDLDGVLADFGAAYGRVADSLFPEDRARRTVPTDSAPETREDRRRDVPSDAPEDAPADRPVPARERRSAARRRNRVWKAIRSTPDFWLTLDPIDPDVVRRLHDRAVDGRWELFFVTQRPATAGDTVQRQTQRWLAEQGFELPSVIVHEASRGALAAALELDALVDDTVEHCVDVISQSSARAILVAPETDEATEANARRLGIEICAGPAASVDLLDAALGGRTGGFFRRARRAAGSRQRRQPR